MKNENYSKLFVILCSLNITCLLISNVITVKTINIFGLIYTAADVIFPITYILNDVFTEVYGFNKSRFVITIALPSNEQFEFQNDLINIVGSTPRILIASFISFLVGNFANSVLMSKMKVKTEGKYLALRTITSTIVGEGLDTILFVPLVFIGNLDLQNIIKLIIDIYAFKVLLEVILTPVTYKIVNIIKNKENIDTFDSNIKYKVI